MSTLNILLSYLYFVSGKWSLKNISWADSWPIKDRVLQGHVLKKCITTGMFTHIKSSRENILKKYSLLDSSVS